MYGILSDISRILSSPFLNIVNELNQIPILASLVLGLIGALAPCQLTGNIGAITFYGNRSLQSRSQWIEIGFFVLGKIVVFSGLGLAVWLLGREFQDVLPNYFSVFRKLMGPLFILIGLVLFGFVKMRWLDSVSRLIPLRKKEGKLGSFLMGVSFSIAFCPTMFTLFFFSLMPIVLTSSYGVVLPSLFAVGTSLPVLVFAGIITFIGLDGALLKKSRKIGNTIQKAAAILFIIIGILDTITYWM
ncbi:sulfite exporter TauE/SafE family protein [Bacillus sp. DNRA2]|uniref:urease accessory protein UreH domain-containing protein n=1 Tax=Bacillus sp. DNRA2 TaxID=2723053 RepID=UPI00145D6AB5|nr:sulfite exporter TauE/SafE family protein [Bacillus sp. DNRA2]NMD68879.1 sulfite exporter TauE/SafE family protein [Bacillus sp. DNRA2]